MASIRLWLQSGNNFYFGSLARESVVSICNAFMDDQGVIRTAHFEDRFRSILSAYLGYLRVQYEAEENCRDSDCMPAVEMMTRELLDEYGVVVTKRLEGALVSTDEALRLTPMDIEQLIPSLESRRSFLRRLRRKSRIQDIDCTERLLARTREMQAAYGPLEKDDLLWPKLNRASALRCSPSG